MRRFPSNLIFWRTIVDLVRSFLSNYSEHFTFPAQMFSVQFVVLNAYQIDNLDGSVRCRSLILLLISLVFNSSFPCDGPLAFLTQFCVLASLACAFLTTLPKLH